ncbi:GNAT family N-acetyltransferase [bacterium]|nr:GNAT family N-acetyltransferase [bacterium]
MEIRPETPADVDAIHDVTDTAFAPMPFSAGDEAACIRKLRADGDLTLSLVAVIDGDVVGHVAFSPVFFDARSVGWLGLGPVAVRPHLQRRGVGSALIRQGLAQVKASGAKGCVLIGDPGYYHRFGFVADGRLTYRDLAARYVQWLTFGAERPSGVLTYSPGLE